MTDAPPGSPVSAFDFGDGPVPAHRHINRDGSPGGWVADTAHVASTARVADNARVFGDARVFGTAWVADNARDFGDARVSDGENAGGES